MTRSWRGVADVLTEPRTRLGLGLGGLLGTVMVVRRDRVGPREARVFLAVNGLTDALYPAAWVVMQAGGGRAGRAGVGCGWGGAGPARGGAGGVRSRLAGRGPRARRPHAGRRHRGMGAVEGGKATRAPPQAGGTGARIPRPRP